jgi:DNA-binding transcriptional ArsR family regulator
VTGRLVTCNHMVVHQRDHGAVRQQTDRLFHALSDATRRDIVRRTMDHPLSVSTLASNYPMSFAAVQKHVAVLERAELISKRRHGREQLVSGNPQTIERARQLLDDLEMLWHGRITRIDAVLAGDAPERNDR